jgi:hypothetical protein
MRARARVSDRAREERGTMRERELIRIDHFVRFPERRPIAGSASPKYFGGSKECCRLPPALLFTYTPTRTTLSSSPSSRPPPEDEARGSLTADKNASGLPTAY